jgi:aspartyl-tRNA(Asn)/glutamyl-tRNA(Gln) amidotransferase subunit B
MISAELKKKYKATIGIECHVQLNTATKLFAGVDNDARDAEANTLISPLCVGLPGTLPVLNAQAVTLAVRAGIALKSQIADYSKFDRKHYFYPDLPLGYQITQFDEPTILAGLVEAPLPDGSTVSVRIHHAHLEADAGKSTHPSGKDYSLVDLNRAGTPLIEIVSEPDMHTAEEAKAYAHELYLLMKYAGVSNANLFYGNMRFDVNVSVSASDELGTRTETKNINSFRAVEKVVEYEVDRQIAELEAGNSIPQETRGWDDSKQKTFSQRSKEDAHDYRYFPDPDLPPVVIEQSFVDEQRLLLPLMPEQLRQRFAVLGLDSRQVESLLEEPNVASELSSLVDAHDVKTAKTVANWLSGELARLVSEEKLVWEQVVNKTRSLIELVAMMDGGLLSSTAAKDMLLDLVTQDITAQQLAEDKDLLQVSDTSELEMIVAQVLSENQKAAEDVKNGEMKAIGFLVGQVMKASQGKANPGAVQTLIKAQLGTQ